MLRDVRSGLMLAALTGALSALGMHFGPLNWKLGDDAFDLLVVVGIMLSATAFFVELVGSSLNRRVREEMAEIDERTRRFEETTRARALWLNAYAVLGRDCMVATEAALGEPRSAEVIPFSPRRQQPRRPATAYPQSSA
jgi:hypothetical protein